MTETVGGALDADTIALLRRAMLPLDGSIHAHAPEILSRFRRVLPAAAWRDLTFVDLTAGSCLFGLMLAAAGARHILLNDVAPRSTLAAQALFGAADLDPARVRVLLENGPPRLAPHTPSFHFISDYLTEGAAEIFDRLFHAHHAEAERAGYRYLALRWALGFAPSAEEGMQVLYTHDLDRLLTLEEGGWEAFVARARAPRPVIEALIRDINAARRRIAGAAAEIHQEDMLTLAPRLRYALPALVAINPPTNGLDEYVIDDQVAHSLMANRLLPLSMCDQTAEAFWRTRVRAAIDALPAGAWYMVWGGDGALDWESCMAEWSQGGVPLVVNRFPRKPHGWAIFERR